MKNTSIQFHASHCRNIWRSQVLSGFVLLLLTGNVLAENPAVPIPSLYQKKDLFEEAITAGKFERSPNRRVTGITVPHHLLAPDLISLGFHSAAGGSYERVLLLSPDHFRRARKPFATTTRDFLTVLGEVPTDVETVKTLCLRNHLVEEADLFDREHGIQTMLPFVAHFFPNAKVIPLAIRADSDSQDWRELVDVLKPLISEQTLIVQSTDFSHYLTESVANRRDQETMNVISGGSLDELSRLQQPQHLDALAAQWIHQALQAEVFGARPTVVAHRNSNHYTATPQRETTSYLVQVFEKESSINPPWPAQEGDALFFFAGDTFLGRNFLPIVSHPDSAAEIQQRISLLTGGAPLILNLEGVLSEEASTDQEENTLLMPDTLTLDWLRALNVVGVSLANNHSHDRGQIGWERSRRKLEKHGIAVVGDQETHDFGPFRLAALTDLSNQVKPYTQRLNREIILSALPEKTPDPLFCFLHWGREWMGEPGAREEQLTRHFFEGGASVILGAHPHTVSKGVEALRGGRNARVYSMGNFLFDQRSPKASGALIEARFFQSGTYALRWIPLENPYEPKAP
ncbi:MAG: AmmeMemoRadiSam system protein B [Verrucomicrobiales bacterium]|nr:AmmeMemoRadiSam system protein B [Verrucomicrobiales bacterium]